MQDDDKLTVLDCFSGIGGFSLGLERAGGFTTKAFIEIDPFCRAVLKKHWPEVPCHDDITTREFVAGEADIVCGGFPCQDISNAGKRAGITGSRSGLWRELVRAIRVVRPKYAVVENVAALASNGLGTVCGDLAEIGYDAEWNCIPACAVGAPHIRDRIWIVACPWRIESGERHDATEVRRRQEEAEQARLGSDDANADIAGLPERQGQDAERAWSIRWPKPERSEWWDTEPDVGRVANGIPARVDRLRSLGNAVVPQIPELIGRAIMEVEQCTTTTTT